MRLNFIFAIVIILILGCTNTQLVDVSKNTKPILGNPNAPVLITEYSDFECPFCGRAENTIKDLEIYYGDKIKIEYRNFPLTDIHPYSLKAAEAGECAADQGKFWQYHDILFSNQNALGDSNLKDYAKQLGLNTTQFNSCLDSDSKKAIVISEEKMGEGLGVKSTPTFFINGQILEGAQPFSAFKSIIDSQLPK